MTGLLTLEDLCKPGDVDESLVGSTPARGEEMGGTTVRITGSFEVSKAVATLEDLLGDDGTDLVII